MLTGLDDVDTPRSAFTAAAASMVAPAAQPSSPHGHANSAAIVSDSVCDSDQDYNPAAVESEVSSTDDEEEASVTFSWRVERAQRQREGEFGSTTPTSVDYAPHQFASFQLQKATPAASGASRQAPVAKKRKTRKRSVSASAEASTVAPTSSEALATEGTVKASSSQARPAASHE